MTDATSSTRKPRSDKGTRRTSTLTATQRRTTSVKAATATRVQIATSEIDVLDELAKIMDQLERRDNAQKWYIHHKYIAQTFAPQPAQHAAQAAQDAYKLIVQSIMLLARVSQIGSPGRPYVLADVTARMSALRAGRIAAGAEDGI